MRKNFLLTHTLSSYHAEKGFGFGNLNIKLIGVLCSYVKKGYYFCIKISTISHTGIFPSTFLQPVNSSKISILN